MEMERMITSYFSELDETAAFNEIKEKLGGIYSQKERERLSKENQQIKQALSGKLEEIQYPDALKEIVAFYSLEPFIYRVIAHNLIDPEDIETRTWLRKTYISEEQIDYYRERWIWEGLLEGSDLAKSKKVKTIPQHLFLAGQMLDVFLKDYSHFEHIDHVKLAGVKESIEDLRETRIKTNGNMTIIDYSPLYIDTNIKHNAFSYDLDREVFSEPDFKKFQNEEFYQMENDVIRVLCRLLFLTKSDHRQDRFFGSDLKEAKINFTIHFKNDKKHIPCQILPKFRELASKGTDDAKQGSMLALLEAARKAGEIWADSPEGYIKAWRRKKRIDAYRKNNKLKRDQSSAGDAEKLDRLSKESLDPSSKWVTPENLNPEEEMIRQEKVSLEDSILKEIDEDKELKYIAELGRIKNQRERKAKSRKMAKYRKKFNI